MTMAYILAVQSNILSAIIYGFRNCIYCPALAALSEHCSWQSLQTNLLAPGMGPDTYFAYTVVLGMYVYSAGIVYIKIYFENWDRV